MVSLFLSVYKYIPLYILPNLNPSDKLLNRNLNLNLNRFSLSSVRSLVCSPTPSPLSFAFLPSFRLVELLYTSGCYFTRCLTSLA